MVTPVVGGSESDVGCLRDEVALAATGGFVRDGHDVVGDVDQLLAAGKGS
jgi:hypothetical protein